MWNKLFAYARKYPARIAGYVSALTIWLNKDLPAPAADFLIPSIIFIIGFGEWSQSVEDNKTIKALYMDSDPNKSDIEEIRGL